MNDRQAVELFHLLVLDRLGRRLDKGRYALKGGCNLRFFFLSPRYSEDMDIDAQGLRADLLRDRINEILDSKGLSDALAVRQMAIEHVTEAKQTETVQRWKVGLRVANSDRALPTKIEISRRGIQPGVRFENVRPEILREYGLAPILAAHYDANAAARQKLEALMTRATPQARDVFDLYLLAQSGANLTSAARETGRSLEVLTGRMLEISYKIFRGQVWPFLPPDQQVLYADEDTWNAILLRLAEMLQERPA